MHTWVPDGLQRQASWHLKGQSPALLVPSAYMKGKRQPVWLKELGHMSGPAAIAEQGSQ